MKGDQLIAEKTHEGFRSHSTKLIPAIQDICEQLNIRIADFDGIAVGQGPGSYTGVRVGITAAKTMAWIHKLPLIAVSSLEALAHSTTTSTESDIDHANVDMNGNEDEEWLIPLIDARRSNVYTGLYTRNSCLAEDALRPLEDWLAEIKSMVQVKQKNCIFVGDEALKEAVEKWISEQGWNASYRETKIQAVSIGAIALREWGKQGEDQYYSLVPNYTQLAEVDKNLEAKQR